MLDRKRRRRRTQVVRVLALLTAALVLTGCGTSGSRTWQGRGVSVRIPPGWHATRARLTPVTAPVQFLAVASYPLPRGDRGADGCEPKAAVDRLPSDGAFIFGWEYVGTAEGPIRKRDFPVARAAFGSSTLDATSASTTAIWLRFRASRRYFQVQVRLGKRASEQTRELALRVLDSLVVEPR